MAGFRLCYFHGLWGLSLPTEEHAASCEAQYRRAAELRPVLVNSHSGKDWFSTEENLLVLRRAARLEEELGLPVAHEVHRGRAPFSTTATAALLERMPDLKLAADFSHWCCVHESLLEDQEQILAKAIDRSFHIHARIGHPEGPPVSAARAPEGKG